MRRKEKSRRKIVGYKKNSETKRIRKVKELVGYKKNSREMNPIDNETKKRQRTKKVSEIFFYFSFH